MSSTGLSSAASAETQELSIQELNNRPPGRAWED